MATDSQNHQNGLSGQGRANYSSAAWRAGDSERQRQQSLASESGSDGDMYGVPILIFMGLCVWGAIEFTNYFDIHVENEKYLWGGAAAVGYVVGIIIRNFLLMIFGLAMAGIFLLFVGMVIYNTITSDQGEDKDSRNIPVIPEMTSQQPKNMQVLKERLKDTKSTVTLPKDFEQSSNCRPCEMMLNSESVSADIKEKQMTVCVKYEEYCFKHGYKW